VPPSFEDAVREVSALSFRDDLVVRQIAAPTNLAPHALALAADVRPDDEGEDSAYGTGRFILLHDPDEPAAWGGAWRVVCFAQAPLEVSIAVDPLLAGVAWSWLMDALESRKAEYRSASGTSTKTLSRGFGTLEAEGDGAQIELRASWSPAARIAPHVEAWAELVCMLAGLPPGSEDITVLGSRRSTRG
jgi:hypothetical protein